MPSSDPVQRFTDIVENIDRIKQFPKGLNAATFASFPGAKSAASATGCGAARIWLVIERDLPPLRAACPDALRALSRDRPPA